MRDQVHSSAAGRRGRPLSAAQECILFAVLFGLGLALQLAALLLPANA